MSATATPVQFPDTTPVVAYDREAQAWLVLHPARVGGMPTWLLGEYYDDRARAEQAAGHHARPPRAWLVHDPVLGWRVAKTSFGSAWLHDVAPCCEMTEAVAKALLVGNPLGELWVIRTDGRLTRPDVQPHIKPDAA